MKKLVVILFLALVSLMAHSQCTVDILSPDTVTLKCGDTLTLQHDTLGQTAFSNNFNNGTVGFGWQTTSSATLTNPCLTKSSTYLWLGQASPAPRSLTSLPMNVSCGGDIEFDLAFAIQGTAAPCEGPDLTTEGVYLQYRVGFGAWTTIFYFQPNITGSWNAAYPGAGDYTAWARYTFPIPLAAQSTTTSFRWIQTASTSLIFDHWGVDDIVITNLCGGTRHLWSTGDTTLSTGPLTALVDTSYWVRRTNAQQDTCWDTVQFQVDYVTFDAVADNMNVCDSAEVDLEMINIQNLDPNYTYSYLWGPSPKLHTDTGKHVTTKPITGTQTFYSSIEHPVYDICDAADTVTVQLNNPLFFGPPARAPEHCMNQGGNDDGIISVNAYGSRNPLTFTIGNQTGPNSWATGLDTGVYVVIVKDPLTKCSIDTVLMVEGDPGLFVDSLVAVDPLCWDLDGSATVYVHGNFGNLTYKWNDASGQFADTNTVLTSDRVTGLSKGNYFVHINDNRCIDTVPFQIIAPDSIRLNIQTNQNPVCELKPTQFTGNTRGGTPAYQYFWSTGVTAPGFSSLITEDTTVSLYVIDDNGCVSDTIHMDLHMVDSISADINYVQDCPGEIIPIWASPIGGDSSYVYDWSITSTNSDTVYWVIQNNLPVMVTISDGCTQPITVSTTLTSYYVPTPRLNSDPSADCVPFTARFEAPELNVASWEWAWEQNTVIGPDFAQEIHVTAPGIIPVRVTYTTTEGCQETAHDTIRGFANPHANFTWMPEELDEYLPTAVFVDQSTGHTYNYWTFEDGSYTNQPAVQHQFIEPGVYYVKLEVETEFGCVDDTIRRIEVLPKSGVWVPNTFTPNRDNLNDIWMPIVYNIDETEYEVSVFNRWGNLLFHSTDPTEGWDGTYQGDMVSDGVYVYQIHVWTMDRKLHNVTGTITILK